ncbi:hypothetical protein HMPREF9370_1631 [Neisseria wadsworthii 9715]|uniref:Uncharacterized protein n=1 Tax=Neisseria wadsworthii 9715 TaxID=1030841 RepID=G4CRC1_9NEIS|nr:hypothetical protein HMPREF9370_1631 [Neisseria wadsworthii 9715]
MQLIKKWNNIFFFLCCLVIFLINFKNQNNIMNFINIIFRQASMPV